MSLFANQYADGEWGGALYEDEAKAVYGCGDDPEAKQVRLYTRAEVLAFGERVREACDLAARLHPGNPMRGVRAVDVARLLEET